ncbi:MAG: hypothetical protein LBU70_09695 [Chitinispirillales bacterium]|jgi:hypothetical protein|nr:hypothetical protein [Chitinispirillales bacterium]
MKRTVAIALTLLSLIFFSCDCDGCWGNKIVYLVDGVASNIRVEFHNEYGDLEAFSSIALPWRKEFNVQFRGAEYYGGDYSGYFPAYISAHPRYGRVTVSIYVNGKLKATKDSAPPNRIAATRFAVGL